MNNNYMQVGRTIKCGACDNRFEHCDNITSKYPTLGKCKCICHSPQKECKPEGVGEWINEFDYKFVRENPQGEKQDSWFLLDYITAKEMKEFISNLILQEKAKWKGEVEKICADTFSGATPREHKELDQFYKQLTLLK